MKTRRKKTRIFSCYVIDCPIVRNEKIVILKEVLKKVEKWYCCEHCYKGMKKWLEARIKELE